MNNSNKDNSLQIKYDNLCTLIRLHSINKHNDLNISLRKIISSFMQAHKKVAIYCYGYHTQMLLTDFVAELRDVVCIIDNGNVSNDSSFQIIKDGDIEQFGLDGVVVSSFKHMNEIKQGLHDNHKEVDVLDIYEELAKQGIILEHDFFYAGPYQSYSRINTLLMKLEEGESIDLLRDLLKEYVSIKDFRLAGDLSKKIYNLTGDKTDKEISDATAELYEMQISKLAHSGKNNVLMLCLDGMRRQDFIDGQMEKIYELVKNSSCIYSNAYSYSTMTYESLVPTFEENTDQKTDYYLREEVDSKDCRFIKKALEEKRFVAVYGDGNHYIYDDAIKYSGYSQTVTEKLWDFIIDCDGVDNGIFYLHELYESHYSFANPYSKKRIVSQGAAMLFDFLPQNSGCLRTDYKKQHGDAIRYLDDTLTPFLEVLPCSLVLFADHGNLILEHDTELKDIDEPKLHAGEEWIRIPLAIRVNGQKPRMDNRLISLMELNDIMLSVMAGNEYRHDEPEFIKIGRSAIYNQQFRELYRLMSSEYNGEAFEGFIFTNGYKLLVFSDGKKSLYSVNDDSLICDDKLADELFDKVKKEITFF